MLTEISVANVQRFGRIGINASQLIQYEKSCGPVQLELREGFIYSDFWINKFGNIYDISYMSK